MPWFRAFFLVAILLATSGYRFRCWWFCTDQTAIQNDYIEQRDRCRDYAQLKLDMAMRDASNPEDKDRKSMLVSLFSDCMANNGWTVPNGREEVKAEGAPAKPAAAPATNTASLPVPAAPAPVLIPPAALRSEEKAALNRQAECAFARQAASASVNAKARAEACDLECEARLKAAPEAPRPAACPPAHMTPSDFANGIEKE